ncbi:MAG: hypothetical protein ABSC15_01550 [Terriglobales bacterium]|jgi:hypothetical protein
MRRSSESGASSCRSKIFFSIATLAFAWSALNAQTALPKYDLHTETKLKGTVEEIRLPPKANDVVHLMMKNGEDLVDLYFCPKSFMDDMGVAFSKGDEVAFTGSKVKYGGADLILAREVVKGSDTLVLRDDKGNPVWSWKH